MVEPPTAISCAHDISSRALGVDFAQMEDVASGTATDEFVQTHPEHDGIEASKASDTPRSWRSTVSIFSILLIVATVSGVIAGAGFRVFVEAGPIEQSQAILWALIAALALYLSMQHTQLPNMAAMFVFSIAAAAASAREFDAHVHLNPEALGDYGVRFRIDWWLDFDVDFVLKSVWLAIALTMVAVVMVPLWFGRVPLLRAVRRHRPIALLLCAVVVSMVIGVVCDDLLRFRVPLAVAQTIEELAESVAPVAYMLAVLLFHRSVGIGWDVDETHSIASSPHSEAASV